MTVWGPALWPFHVRYGAQKEGFFLVLARSYMLLTLLLCTSTSDSGPYYVP